MSKAKKATRKTLARIEACLATLRDEVSAIRQDLEVLAGGSEPMDRDEIIEFLDRYRAGEAMAATGLGAWIAASDTPGLRGSLRAIQHGRNAPFARHRLPGARRRDAGRERGHAVRRRTLPSADTRSWGAGPCRIFAGLRPRPPGSA